MRIDRSQFQRLIKRLCDAAQSFTAAFDGAGTHLGDRRVLAHPAAQDVEGQPCGTRGTQRIGEVEAEMAGVELFRKHQAVVPERIVGDVDRRHAAMLVMAVGVEFDLELRRVEHDIHRGADIGRELADP